MTSLEQYNQQRNALISLNEQEELLNAALKLIRKQRKELMCYYVTESDVLSDALDAAGIESYFSFKDLRVVGSVIMAEAFLYGKYIPVSFNLETGLLLIDGNPVK